MNEAQDKAEDIAAKLQYASTQCDHHYSLDRTAAVLIVDQAARIRQLEEALVATTVPLDLYHAYGWADRAGIREQVRAALKGDPS